MTFAVLVSESFTKFLGPYPRYLCGQTYQSGAFNWGFAIGQVKAFIAIVSSTQVVAVTGEVLGRKVRYSSVRSDQFRRRGWIGWRDIYGRLILTGQSEYRYELILVHGLKSRSFRCCPRSNTQVSWIESRWAALAALMWARCLGWNRKVQFSVRFLIGGIEIEVALVKWRMGTAKWFLKGMYRTFDFTSPYCWRRDLKAQLQENQGLHQSSRWLDT